MQICWVKGLIIVRCLDPLQALLESRCLGFSFSGVGRCIIGGKGWLGFYVCVGGDALGLYRGIALGRRFCGVGLRVHGVVSQLHVPFCRHETL